VSTQRDARTPRSNPARRRADVLAAALALFNSEGTAPVSTNHIAKAAGISPGNLYYWFPNKQAIIRALFDQWRDESTLATPPGDEPAAVLAALVGAIRRQVGLTQRFAVFARELVPLLHADAELADQYRQTFETRVSMFVGIVDLLIDAGLIRRPAPPADVRSLVEVTWIATENTPSFLDIMRTTGLDADDAAHVIAAPLLAQLTRLGRDTLRSTATGGPADHDNHTTHDLTHHR
jgi:TetR/AcrR family transcriptional regulator, repressor for uid operon